MFKLASLALIPVLAATFYPHDGAPKSAPSVPTIAFRTEVGASARASIHEEDRQFLDVISQQESELVSRLAAKQADQEFLINLQEEDLIPVRRATLPDRSTPDDPWADAVREGHEVRRAIPVERPTVVIPTATIQAVALTSETHRRSALQQSYATLADQEPEIRRAIPVNRQRPSISIYGEKVVVLSNAPSLQ
jgi:hypothetical protein